MSKRVVILIGVALFLGAWLGSAAFAQDSKGVADNEAMLQKGMKMNQEAREEQEEHGMMGKCPMCGMMKGMMEKNMLATTDGGVVILIGNKLMKYDEELNLVKEVEIKIDAASMQKNMMKNCPMMQGGMMGKEMMDKGMEKKAVETK